MHRPIGTPGATRAGAASAYAASAITSPAISAPSITATPIATTTIATTTIAATAIAATAIAATGIAATALLAVAGFQRPALAGSLTGTASYRERIALPPDAVFEAVLIDVAIADAPARELARVRLQPAGQAPLRFSIPYRDADLRPAGRYSVRATVRQGDRLLFTTDTITPVLSGGPSQPLNLVLVAVGAARPATAPSPVGRSPSLRGTLWRLQALQDGGTPKLIAPPAAAVELRFDPDSERVGGSGGCNRLAGGVQRNGEQLRLSRLVSTQMACPPAVMAFERRFVEALGQVRRFSLDRSNLLLQDGRGRTLLLFTATP